MFSANENIMLREHKKRIVGFVEDCIPDDVKDAGTMVMVMQLTCQAPGCVPLETAVIVIFPPSDHELLPGLPQSGGGTNTATTTTTTTSSSSSSSGNFQTKILKPMAEVTRDDVLDALPPAFLGGRRTMDKLCLKARDVMLAQITQIMGDNTDQEGRRLMAEYLIDCLQEYIKRDCVPPEYGEPYPPREPENESGGVKEEDDEDVVMTTALPESAVALSTTSTTTTTTKEMITRTNNTNTTMTKIPGTGNLVIRRALDAGNGNENGVRKPAASHSNTPSSNVVSASTASAAGASGTHATSLPAAAPSQMDWRNRQRQQGLLSNVSGGISSSGSSIVARLAEREHAPGIRRPGCPCCDPDNISNILDKMMSM